MHLAVVPVLPVSLLSHQESVLSEKEFSAVAPDLPVNLL